MNISNKPSVGYVFQYSAFLWGVLHYGQTPTTYTIVLAADDANTACTKLAQRFAGEFRKADRDQIAWGKILPTQVLA
jgi:hypothetical protein